MDLTLIIVVITASVAAVIVGLLVIGFVGMSVRVRRARAVPTSKPDRAPPLAGVRSVVDQSIGMYLLRRLSGRPTSPPAEPTPSETPSLTADEIAYRLRLSAAVPPDRQAVPPASAAVHQAQTARPAPGMEPRAPRERLARDTGLALAGLLAVGLVAVLIWPAGSPGQQPAGSDNDIAGASDTPETSASAIPVATSVVGAGESPGGSVAEETFAPSAAATPAQPTPPRATPRPTTRPTPRAPSAPTPTPRVTTTPLPTPVPSPEPSESVTPTPSPTLEPTPSAEPTPPPEPTPSASAS